MVRTCPTFWIDFAAHHEHMLHHLNPVSKLCQPGSVEEGTPSTQSQGMGQTWSAPWISTSPNRSAVRKQNKEYPSSPCCCNFSFTSLPSCRVRYGVDGRWILGIAVPAQYVPATCGWFNQFEPSWSPVFLSHGVFEARHWCWTLEGPP